MGQDLYSQRFTSILISVKFMGIWWEFWQENVTIGDESKEFFQEVKRQYKRKFGDKPFKMRLYYPSEDFVISNNSVKHL